MKKNMQAFIEFSQTFTAELSFRTMEDWLKFEPDMYKKAKKEAGEVTFGKAKKEAAVEEAHKAIISHIKKKMAMYDELYTTMDAEWRRFAPKYRMGKEVSTEDLDYNRNEFKRFCNNIAMKYGQWFWEERLRHDPLDDGCHGSVSVRQLQEYDSGAWYEADWCSDWTNLPYGAKLMKLYFIYFWDFTHELLERTGKIQKGNYPSKNLRELLKKIE